jgi:3-deoxy-D-manno-octulosonic-acid transferase
MLVPRHRDRFADVADLLKRRGVPFARRSEMENTDAPSVRDGPRVRDGPSVRDAAVLLGDTLGELALLYASADVAFVGGSLVAVGGHNLLEPAALGLPVLTGPSYENSQDIAQLLLTRGAALQVGNAAELAATIERLLADPAERRRIGAIGQEIVASNRGSVERLLALVPLA